MTQLEVRLLGHPVVLLDGRPTAPPRGAKPWGLLAYLASSARRHPRSELAELLFSGAEDPLGALRWNLAALRRLLDRDDALKGDAIALDLPVGTTVDTRLVEAGDPVALAQPGLGQDLLAGVSFPGSPGFEMWLVTERRQLARRSAALLRDATLAHLVRGEEEAAIGLATRLVTLDPLDEGHHALLIRTHARAGDGEGARRQFDRCREVLRRELGCEPGAAVVAAVHSSAPARPRAGAPGRSDVVGARLSVAWQSFLAGAIDQAIDLGRGAVAMADATDDEALPTVTRIYLSAMLSMSVRGWDEAVAALSEALLHAERCGRSAEAATALGILAGNDMMRADYVGAARRARSGLARSDDPGARALNLMFLAAIDADTGQGEPIEHARQAVDAAVASADPVTIVYATGHAGRVLLMRGDIAPAREMVERALAVTAGAMLALRPWLMAMQAEIQLAEGDVESAMDTAEQAATLAVTTDVAYQQALAHRVLGLAEAARGNPAAAVERLILALACARRTTGEGYAFHWPIAFVLDSLSTVTAAVDPGASQRWARALHDHATNIGMHAYVARARCHLAATGDAVPVRSW